MEPQDAGNPGVAPQPPVAGGAPTGEPQVPVAGEAQPAVQPQPGAESPAPQPDGSQVENWKAIREELKKKQEAADRLEAENRQYKELLFRGAPQPGQPAGPPAPPVDPEAFVTVGQVNQGFEKLAQVFAQKLEEIGFRVKNQGAEQLVTQYLEPVLAQNPVLMKALLASKNPTLAVEFAKVIQQLKGGAMPGPAGTAPGGAMPDPSKDPLGWIERMIANSQLPGTPQGGAPPASGPDYKNMPRDQFMRLVDGVINGATK